MAKVATTRLLMVAPAMGLAAAALFTFNGLGAEWERPDHGTLPTPAVEHEVHELRVMALNLAKCFFYRGGLSFAPAAEVEQRLDLVLELVAAEDVDLLYLSEVVIECGPTPVDQVRYLAEGGGFHAWAFGENYNFGLPFYRMRSGNALLSRLPLRALENAQLHGAKPFFEPTNNRRILWCELEVTGEPLVTKKEIVKTTADEIGLTQLKTKEIVQKTFDAIVETLVEAFEVNGEPLLTASVRNDSFDIENNLLQAREIVARLAGRPALLAGDFNAEPHTAPMALFRGTGLFAGELDGPPTFPARAPRRRIDYVLAPADWELVSQRVVPLDVSDHLPVVAVYRLRAPDRAASGRLVESTSHEDR